MNKETRIKEVEVALSGEDADLEILQAGVTSRHEAIIKIVRLDDEDSFEITFSNGEIVGGKFNDDEITIAQAECVANAYNINEIDL